MAPTKQILIINPDPPKEEPFRIIETHLKYKTVCPFWCSANTVKTL